MQIFNHQKALEDIVLSKKINELKFLSANRLNKNPMLRYFLPFQRFLQFCFSSDTQECVLNIAILVINI